MCSVNYYVEWTIEWEKVILISSSWGISFFYSILEKKQWSIFIWVYQVCFDLEFVVLPKTTSGNTWLAWSPFLFIAVHRYSPLSDSRWTFSIFRVPFGKTCWRLLSGKRRAPEKKIQNIVEGNGCLLGLHVVVLVLFLSFQQFSKAGVPWHFVRPGTP